jgi:hypothetical protein
MLASSDRNNCKGFLAPVNLLVLTFDGSLICHNKFVMQQLCTVCILLRIADMSYKHSGNPIISPGIAQAL